MQPRMSARGLLVLVALTGGLALAGPGVAAADTMSAASDSTVSLTGPVGIGAVVLGVVGLLTGLLRHRKRATAAARPAPASATNTSATRTSSTAETVPAQRRRPEPAHAPRS